jgi:hypothetical protein
LTYIFSGAGYIIVPALQYAKCVLLFKAGLIAPDVQQPPAGSRQDGGASNQRSILLVTTKISISLSPMHPRSTRNHPLMLLKQKNRLFSNNISSPGFLCPSLFKAEATRKQPVYIDAVSCQSPSNEIEIESKISV